MIPLAPILAWIPAVEVAFAVVCVVLLAVLGLLVVKAVEH